MIIITILIVMASFSIKKTSLSIFDYPKSWPKPVYDFDKNPLTEEKFELGRKLFYDPILSRDGTISCASCHLQATGFTHIDHELSHGIDGEIGERNSLTLQNLAWNKSFMWDGGINHLDMQALAPITNKVEMDEEMDRVVFKLNQNALYQKLFKNAFDSDVITGQITLKAIAQFLVQLKTYNSKYDKVLKGEINFSDMEKKGYEIFKDKCASCHKEPLFTSSEYKNNGLEIDPTINDFGRMKITQKSSDSLLFKVPTLRNIEFSFPYMHDGRFSNLVEVINHYSLGIKKSKTLSKELKKPLYLTDNQRTELIAFLRTLSDKEFLFNKKYGYPK
jgi:cytochrome c peroxidase